MKATALSRDQVLARLRAAREEDLKYKDGRILSSMCTSPHSMAKLAQLMFSDSNLGDPGLFPGTFKLEREAISFMAELLHGNGVGFIVSGGTEANLLALYAARKNANTEAPEVVLPESAHFSFVKICDMLKMKPVYAKSDSEFRVSIPNVKQLISKNTVAIVGSAGSAELGTIDPIGELSDIAKQNGIHLHVDAAFGGFVIPFLKDLGYDAPEFDFQLEGVQTITVDPHKMGMCIIPAGGILFRNHSLIERIKTGAPYLTEPNQFTFVGTRPGASAAATWTTIATLGREGYRRKVKHCMNLAMKLVEGLEGLGLELLIQPAMNIVAFRSANSKALAEELQKRGWFVSYVPRLDCIRVVLMPHVTRKHLETFLTSLCESIL